MFGFAERNKTNQKGYRGHSKTDKMRFKARRDAIHLWGVVTTAWMYATPIFYPLELLPDTLQNLMVWNPMYQYITYFRDIMMNNVAEKNRQGRQQKAKPHTE